MINIRHIHSFNLACACAVLSIRVSECVCARLWWVCAYGSVHVSRMKTMNELGKHTINMLKSCQLQPSKSSTHTKAMCLGIWRAAQIFRFSLSQPHLFITHSWGKSTELFLFKLAFSYSFSLPLLISFSNPVVLVVIHPFNPKIYTQTLYNV